MVFGARGGTSHCAPVALSGNVHRASAAPPATRRQCLHLLSSSLAAAVAVLEGPSVSPAAAAAAAAAVAPSSQLTPYQRGLALEYGLSKDGRIRSCPTDANPNCVSTSATNMTYMPAWEAPPGSTPAGAMQQFEAALRSVSPEAAVVESGSWLGGEYRRFAVRDPLFDHDDIEVLISLQRAPYESEPPLVTFRSMAAQVRYVWPIQQAISDFGEQRKRLKAVRQQLGWRLLGCDLLECYEEIISYLIEEQRLLGCIPIKSLARFPP